MGRQSGGLIIIHNKTLKSRLVFVHANWILIEISINDTDIFILNVYINPNNNLVFNEFDIFLSNFLTQNNNRPILIVGDFNSRISSWN